jgi:Tfp pilus assembly protein PilF
MIKIYQQIKENQFTHFFSTHSVLQVGIFLLASFITCVGISLSQEIPPYDGVAVPANNNNKATTTIPMQPPNADATTNPVIKAELEKAVAAFNNSKRHEALDILNALYKSHPEIAPPRVVMAQMFAQAKLGEAVRANLEFGTEETPTDPEAYLLLGEIALRQGHLTAAELLLKRADETVRNYAANPTRKKNLQSSLLRVLSDLFEARQRWTQMEQCVDEQIKLDGQNSTFLRRKGIAIFRQNRDNDAKQFFLQADQLDRANKETGQKGLPADAAMSQLYLARGDRDNARSSLENALNTYPDSKEILALAVQMRVSDDKLEEAKPLAETLLSKDPASPAAKRSRAIVGLYLQEYALAEKLFQELLLESPSDSQAQNGLALALCEQGSPDKLKRALEYATDNVRKNQNNSEFWGTLGWVQYKANLIEEAARSLRQSISTGQINAATAFYHARLALKANKIDEAKQFLTLALQGNNQFAKRREAVDLLKQLSQ